MVILARSVFLLSALLCAVDCANILFVVPTLSKSHHIMFGTLIDELLTRGHRITAITTFLNEKTFTNLTEINVRPVRYILLNDLDLNSFVKLPESFFDVYHKFLDYIKYTGKVFSVKEVKDLITSDVKFDLVVYEMFIDDLFIAFAHKFHAPVIAIGSCYMFPYVPGRFAIPANPSYVPSFYSGYPDKMTFLQRVHNTVLHLLGNALFTYWLEPEMTDIAREHFGSDTLRVGEMVKATDLYFINTHWSFYGAQPFPPQVVDVSGIHLKPAKPLAQELDRWMNESVHGVIYFSFGSMLRGATLPAQKVQAFIEVFRQIPHRVLWKWEDDQMDNIPSNVKIMKWLPQRDVLAHPKVRVFISHGGLLGSTEAVVSGVPILGIPMYGDQPNNVAALVDKGVAIHMDYNNISTVSLSWALHQLLTNMDYSANAKALSQRFLDRPMSPLDTAVYWTEYVIRHRGAPHLRSAAVDLTWYQYYLLDVIAFCIVVLLAGLTAVYYIVRSLFRLVGLVSSKKEKTA